jgi:hypothetical protein
VDIVRFQQIIIPGKGGGFILVAMSRRMHAVTKATGRQAEWEVANG